MPTKQFGYRFPVSVSSVADQVPFGCFVQRVRKASHMSYAARDFFVMSQRTWRSNGDGHEVDGNHLLCDVATQVCRTFSWPRAGLLALEYGR